MSLSGSLLIVLLLSFVGSAALTQAVRALAFRVHLIDTPNERSSHALPTPRGGGLAIAAASVTALIALTVLGEIGADLTIALALGGTAIAVVGLLDDRAPLAASIRLSVHFGAAIAAVLYFGGLPELSFGSRQVSLGWLGTPLAVIAIVWSINLFNFMDGIDGIAVSEASFIFTAGAACSAPLLSSDAVPYSALVMGAASLGFLRWNWPPARIFMGDVGSGFLGFTIAVLALAAMRENGAALYVWITLGAVFFVDATITLARRFLRRERVHEAHRSHAYQCLARRWGGHRPVTVAVLLINLLWLLPLAWYGTKRPELAPWLALLGLAMVGVLAVLGGAGRVERT